MSTRGGRDHPDLAHFGYVPLELEAGKGKAPRSMRTEVQILRRLAVGGLVCLAIIVVLIVFYALALIVGARQLVGQAQTIATQVQELLGKPELAAAIDGISAIVSNENITHGVNRINSFVHQPDVARVIATIANVVEELPAMEEYARPLLEEELSKIMDVVHKITAVAAALDPVEAIEFLQTNHLAERVVGVFNLVDKFSTAEQVERMQKAAAQVQSIITALQDKGLTVHL